MHKIPCVLTIAGTDPSGGAGIQADIKTISATGSYAASVVTVLVAQNTQGVQSIYPISPQFVREQIKSVFTDLNIAAVKIGMLYTKEIVNIVVSAIKEIKPKNIVLDPVMTAKDMSRLLIKEDVDYFAQQLFPCVDIITPNLIEAEQIAGCKILTFKNMEDAAKTIAKQFQVNVLIKGGHCVDNESNDVLYQFKNNSLIWFNSKRINTKNTHGTGCTLSSAIASYLAQNYKLREAIKLAKLYITDAIATANLLQVGKGNGPLNHFFHNFKKS